jgi:hypothetical protein
MQHPTDSVASSSDRTARSLTGDVARSGSPVSGADFKFVRSDGQKSNGWGRFRIVSTRKLRARRCRAIFEIASGYFSVLHVNLNAEKLKNSHDVIQLVFFILSDLA